MLPRKGWEGPYCRVPRQVAASEPQFPQGLAFRAGPPASCGSLNHSPGSRAEGSNAPPPLGAHPPLGVPASWAQAESWRRHSAHGRVLPSWVPKHGTQKPGAGCHSALTGKVSGASRPGRRWLAKRGCPFTTGLLGDLLCAGHWAKLWGTGGERAPAPSLVHIGVIPGSQLLAPESSQRALGVQGENPNKLLLITALRVTIPRAGLRRAAVSTGLTG